MTDITDTETDLDRDADLARSVDGLTQWRPDLSAHMTLSMGQRGTLIAVGVMLAAALIVSPRATVIGFNGLLVVIYASAVVYRVLLFRASLRGGALTRIPDDEALALPDHDLPPYTVLVPVYKEPEVVGQLLRALDALNYPRDQLDVRLLVEADDGATIAAAQAARPGPHVTVVAIPPAEPRTKPKALNYGLSGARGELVTIYDAEDLPEPLQLRRAVAALHHLGPDFACVQARLDYYNPRQNLLTRWFTIEYGAWFAHLLPGLVHLGAPVPLGGTSNHFRRDALDAVGGWDPRNVTEDADLGIRLDRFGYRVGVLDSTTLEEANSDAVNWVKQRSRWYKGYLLTWLVHMRNPLRSYRELGWRGFVGLNLFVAGTPLLAMLNPVTWLLSILWLVAQPVFVEALFPGPAYYLAMACLVLGNLACLYLNVLSARLNDTPELVPAALLMPAYWVLMSLAAAKAWLQLVSSPSFWEKTTHGLSTVDPAAHLAAERAGAAG